MVKERSRKTGTADEEVQALLNEAAEAEDAFRSLNMYRGRVRERFNEQVKHEFGKLVKRLAKRGIETSGIALPELGGQDKNPNKEIKDPGN